jgi:c-di-GMP-binding flagellar brake protein YcgR
MLLNAHDLVEVRVASPSANEAGHTARVKEAGAQSLTLLLLPAQRSLASIGTRLTVRKADQDRIVSWDVVVEKVSEKPLALVAGILSSHEQEQRRSHARLAMHLKAKYLPAGPDAIWQSAEICDLSEGGARLLGPIRHEPGECVLLELLVGKTLLRTDGVVRHCTVQDGAAGTFVLGVEFVDLSQDDRGAIVRFLVDCRMKSVREAGSSLYNYIPRPPIRMVRSGKK